MNILELKEANQEYIVYFYHPEGKGERGEILVDRATQEVTVIARAEEDSVIGSYAHKAGNAVKKYIKENYLPLEGVQAWY